MSSEIRRSVIVVFGCRHEKEFLGRVIKAINFALLNIDNPMFIFTGLDAYPWTAGFISSRVVWEDESFDTASNVKNTLKMVKNLGFDESRIFIVSSWYHIPKIRLFLKREGVKLPRRNFVRSCSRINFVNVIIEPFAILAAYFRFNRLPFIITVKRKLGYDV
ncbi:MAG: YdcF family protein [Candidatus Azambacteria bacterium]|nr:YdcF family protein [Candidatus Azambacteria bacterium]